MTSVATAVSPRASVSGCGHADRRDVAVGRVAHPHRPHDPAVVAEGDDRVDGTDHGQHRAGGRARRQHGREHAELGDPAAERRDAGQRDQEDRHHRGQAGRVAEQPVVAGDLARAGLAGHRHHDGEGAEVRGGVDDQVGDDGLQRLRPGARVAGHRQGHEDEAALGDGRVGQHPHDVGLAQREEVADGHRQRRTAPRTAAPTTSLAEREADEQQRQRARRTRPPSRPPTGTR